MQEFNYSMFYSGFYVAFDGGKGRLRNVKLAYLKYCSNIINVNVTLCYVAELRFIEGERSSITS